MTNQTEQKKSGVTGFSSEELRMLVRAAGELWESTDGDDPYDVLSKAQKAILDRAASYYAADDGLTEPRWPAGPGTAWRVIADVIPEELVTGPVAAALDILRDLASDAVDADDSPVI